MKQNYYLGIIAGIASAIFYISFISKSGSTGIISFLTPLPIVLISIGWGRIHGIIASIVGAFIIFSISQEKQIAGVIYLVTSALPFVLLSHLISSKVTHKRADSSQESLPSPSEEWYPISNIVIWAVFISTFLAILFISFMAMDIESYKQTISKLIDEEFLPELKKIPEFNIQEDNIAKLKALTASYLPTFYAGSYFIYIIFNLWLGTRILNKSDRLKRPWPEFSKLDYPIPFIMLLAVVMLLSLILSGMAAIYITAFLASIICAYVIVGISVLNKVTAGAGIFRIILYISILLLCVKFLREVSIIIATLGAAKPLLKFKEEKHEQ